MLEITIKSVYLELGQVVCLFVWICFFLITKYDPLKVLPSNTTLDNYVFINSKNKNFIPSYTLMQEIYFLEKWGGGPSVL